MPGNSFSVAVDHDGGDGGTTAVVLIAGEVDLATAATLRATLYAALDQGPSRLILDCAGVTFIDSTGLGVIVGALKRMSEAGGTMAVRSPTRPTRRVFEVTGLDRIIEIIDAPADAGRA